MIVGMMGGRVAETLIFDEVTNGASSDLKQATDIARRMVCEWGMNEELGPQRFGENEELMFLGREVSRFPELQRGHRPQDRCRGRQDPS